MSRPYEILLTDKFRKLVIAFIKSFPEAAEEYGGCTDEDVEKYLNTYAEVLETYNVNIFRVAAHAVSSYMLQFKIHANQSIDEFKLINFLGFEISNFLEKLGHYKIAQIHSFAVIRMLDYRLETLGLDRPLLTTAMHEMVRRRVLDEKMGNTGAYLLYKCLGETAKEHDLINSKKDK